MPYGITQCYLPPDSSDFPAFTPAEAGTRFSDPARMQDWVDLGGGYDNLWNFVWRTPILKHIDDSVDFCKIVWQSYEQS